MKPFRPFFCFVALSSLALASLRAQTDWPLPATMPAAAGFSADRLALFHRTLDRYVESGKYSGYITLLARDGRLVDAHANGWQDIAAKVPLRTDSIVRIYSMSKVITSVAVLMLMEDGKLKLGDRVDQYLPSLKDRQVLTGGTVEAPVLAPASHPITIHELLTHTAGYYYDADWSAGSPVLIGLFRQADVWHAANLDEFVTRVAKLPLADQPGTRFRYGINMDLLGAIVEKASGQDLDVFLQQRLFGPLGMHDTAFSVPAEKQSRLALTYQPDASGKLAVVPNFPGSDGNPASKLFSGGGGLFSTAGDYARFAQMLLNGGHLGDVRILGRKTVELMSQNHIAHLADPHPFNKPEQGYGLGVRIITDLGASNTPGTLGCFGWDGAATTLFQMDPKEHTVAILLTQHFPFNEDNIFDAFITGYYSALND
jgi:CubicO group peptidase (beta-lactamase class C family)